VIGIFRMMRCRGRHPGIAELLLLDGNAAFYPLQGNVRVNKPGPIDPPRQQPITTSTPFAVSFFCEFLAAALCHHIQVLVKSYAHLLVHLRSAPGESGASGNLSFPGQDRVENPI